MTSQVLRTPDAPAVTSGSTTLTFAELRFAAARLAGRLRSLGVGPGVLVAVNLERSADMVVALLGIALAGGAYVPLDPVLPAERLAFMLGDCGAAVLVTQAALLGTLPPGGAQVVCLDADADADAEADAGAAADPTARASGPEDLAYVIYTSGSTGRPKGVEIPNRALASLLLAAAERPGLGPADVLLANTTLSFDMAGLDMWLPLIIGARLVVAPREAAADPLRLMRLLDESAATFMQATPVTWRMLLDAGWSGRDGFRAICGGEALPVPLADRLLDAGVELWNLYGPTETTIWSTALQVSTRGRPLTVGRPLANTTLSILDTRLRPVPTGEVGELHIGGQGVARGYSGRPDLTAERFLPDPLSPIPGARMYRTGDLGRWHPDGTVEFLGRLDHQVKVRGFRIECGEIEARLEDHPAVRSAVVVASRDQAGDTTLVAYVVPQDRAASDEGDRPLAAELRAALLKSLPDYMVPSAFLPLEGLPLTPSGKVDRKGLPPATALRPGPTGSRLWPRTATEEALADIWAEVLGLGEVGIDEDFFDLGGHSLMAVRVISKVRDAMGAELPLRAIFDRPNVAALAGVVDGLREGAKPMPPLVAQPRSDDEGIPLSLAQEPLWFLDQLVPGNPFYNMPSAYRLRGPLDLDVLDAALTEVVSRHESLRTSFPSTGGRPRQLVGPAHPVTAALVDLSELGPGPGEAEARRLAGVEADRPFDLATGPLLRSLVVRLGPTESLLLLTVHHIVSDGWSTDILLSELSALYGAIGSSAPSPLRPLPVQYADYAVWQRQWLTGERLDAHLDHWQSRLEGAPAALELAPDHPRPALPSYRGAIASFSVPSSVVQALHQRGRSRGATLHMTLLAAFKTLVVRLTGADDIVIGGTTAGRTRTELEDLIGFFVNPLVLRTDLSGDPTFLEVVERVRRTALAAYQHQDAPFEKVVERIAPPRDLSRSPLFQIAFELQEDLRLPGALGSTVGLTDVGGPSGAELGSVGGAGVAARLDLELFLRASASGSLEGSLVYAADLYDHGTMSGLASSYTQVLASVAATPTLRISEVPLDPGADPRHPHRG